MDLEDLLCIKCQARPQLHLSLCRRCFEDLVVNLLGALLVAIIVAVIMTGLLWWPITWILWLIG